MRSLLILVYYRFLLLFGLCFNKTPVKIIYVGNANEFLREFQNTFILTVSRVALKMTLDSKWTSEIFPTLNPTDPLNEDQLRAIFHKILMAQDKLSFSSLQLFCDKEILKSPLYKDLVNVCVKKCQKLTLKNNPCFTDLVINLCGFEDCCIKMCRVLFGAYKRILNKEQRVLILYKSFMKKLLSSDLCHYIKDENVQNYDFEIIFYEYYKLLDDDMFTSYVRGVINNSKPNNEIIVYFDVKTIIHTYLYKNIRSCSTFIKAMKEKPEIGESGSPKELTDFSGIRNFYFRGRSDHIECCKHTRNTFLCDSKKQGYINKAFDDISGVEKQKDDLQSKKTEEIDLKKGSVTDNNMENIKKTENDENISEIRANDHLDSVKVMNIPSKPEENAKKEDSKHPVMLSQHNQSEIEAIYNKLSIKKKVYDANSSNAKVHNHLDGNSLSPLPYHDNTYVDNENDSNNKHLYSVKYRKNATESKRKVKNGSKADHNEVRDSNDGVEDSHIAVLGVSDSESNKIHQNVYLFYEEFRKFIWKEDGHIYWAFECVWFDSSSSYHNCDDVFNKCTDFLKKKLKRLQKTVKNVLKSEKNTLKIVFEPLIFLKPQMCWQEYSLQGCVDFECKIPNSDYIQFVKSCFSILLNYIQSQYLQSDDKKCSKKKNIEETSHGFLSLRKGFFDIFFQAKSEITTFSCILKEIFDPQIPNDTEFMIQNIKSKKFASGNQQSTGISTHNSSLNSVIYLSKIQTAVTECLLIKNSETHERLENQYSAGKLSPSIQQLLQKDDSSTYQTETIAKIANLSPNQKSNTSVETSNYRKSKDLLFTRTVGSFSEYNSTETPRKRRPATQDINNTSFSIDKKSSQNSDSPHDYDSEEDNNARSNEDESVFSYPNTTRIITSQPKIPNKAASELENSKSQVNLDNEKSKTRLCGPENRLDLNIYRIAMASSSDINNQNEYTNKDSKNTEKSRESSDLEKKDNLSQAFNLNEHVFEQNNDELLKVTNNFLNLSIGDTQEIHILGNIGGFLTYTHRFSKLRSILRVFETEVLDSDAVQIILRDLDVINLTNSLESSGKGIFSLIHFLDGLLIKNSDSLNSCTHSIESKIANIKEDLNTNNFLIDHVVTKPRLISILKAYGVDICIIEQVYKNFELLNPALPYFLDDLCAKSNFSESSERIIPFKNGNCSTEHSEKNNIKKPSTKSTKTRKISGKNKYKNEERKNIHLTPNQSDLSVTSQSETVSSLALDPETESNLVPIDTQDHIKDLEIDSETESNLVTIDTKDRLKNLEPNFESNEESNERKQYSSNLLHNFESEVQNTLLNPLNASITDNFEKKGPKGKDFRNGQNRISREVLEFEDKSRHKTSIEKCNENALSGNLETNSVTGVCVESVVPEKPQRSHELDKTICSTDEGAFRDIIDILYGPMHLNDPAMKENTPTLSTKETTDNTINHTLKLIKENYIIRTKVNTSIDNSEIENIFKEKTILHTNMDSKDINTSNDPIIHKTESTEDHTKPFQSARKYLRVLKTNNIASFSDSCHAFSHFPIQITDVKAQNTPLLSKQDETKQISEDVFPKKVTYFEIQVDDINTPSPTSTNNNEGSIEIAQTDFKSTSETSQDTSKPIESRRQKKNAKKKLQKIKVPETTKNVTEQNTYVSQTIYQTEGNNDQLYIQDGQNNVSFLSTNQTKDDTQMLLSQPGLIRKSKMSENQTEPVEEVKLVHNLLDETSNESKSELETIKQPEQNWIVLNEAPHKSNNQIKVHMQFLRDLIDGSSPKLENMSEENSFKRPNQEDTKIVISESRNQTKEYQIGNNMTFNDMLPKHEESNLNSDTNDNYDVKRNIQLLFEKPTKNPKFDENTESSDDHLEIKSSQSPDMPQETRSESFYVDDSLFKRMSSEISQKLNENLGYSNPKDYAEKTQFHPSESPQTHLCTNKIESECVATSKELQSMNRTEEDLSNEKIIAQNSNSDYELETANHEKEGLKSNLEAQKHKIELFMDDVLVNKSEYITFQEFLEDFLAQKEKNTDKSQDESILYVKPGQENSFCIKVRIDVDSKGEKVPSLKDDGIARNAHLGTESVSTNELQDSTEVYLDIHNKVNTIQTEKETLNNQIFKNSHENCNKSMYKGDNITVSVESHSHASNFLILGQDYQQRCFHQEDNIINQIHDPRCLIFQQSIHSNSIVDPVINTNLYQPPMHIDSASSSFSQIKRNFNAVVYIYLKQYRINGHYTAICIYNCENVYKNDIPPVNRLIYDAVAQRFFTMPQSGLVIKSFEALMIHPSSHSTYLIEDEIIPNLFIRLEKCILCQIADCLTIIDAGYILQPTYFSPNLKENTFVNQYLNHMAYFPAYYVDQMMKNRYKKCLF